MIKKIHHDSAGMYFVREVDTSRYDVIQRSSGTVVASAALLDTAVAAANGLNACAVVPRVRNVDDHYADNTELRQWIAQEIRLAMQQENTFDSGLARASVADVRTGRILSKLDGIPIGELSLVPKEQIERITKALVE